MTLDSLKPISTFDADITIVGGGIVGTTLAAALSPLNLKILVIEAQSLEQVVAKRQAYALSLLSGRIFEGIGVWQSIFPHIGKFRHIRLSDADYPHVLKFSPHELDSEFLGYVGEHRVILAQLNNFIAKCDNIGYLSPAEVVDVDYQASAAILTVKEGEKQHHIRTQLVVGADGTRSPIRQKAGIRTKGWKYWQSCIAFSIRHTAPQNDIAFERFWYTGPMGILPLPDNRCQIVWTAPHALAKTLQNLDKREFVHQLQERTEGLLGDIELIGDRFLFPVQLMQSDRYVKPRLALVGDAAHCCHPVGGQGLNLGIRDAAALAQVIGEAVKKGEDIGDLTFLKRYERWRKWENWLTLGFTDFLDRLFSNHWLPVMAARRLGLAMMATFQPMKRFSLQLMTGLTGKSPQLAK